MSNFTFSAGNAGTLTAAFFQGTPDANGNGTGAPVPTPATAVWTSSDPTIFRVTSTGAKTATFDCLASGSVTMTVAVPAASDALNNYSAFSGTRTVQVSLNTITVQSFTITVS